MGVHGPVERFRAGPRASDAVAALRYAARMRFAFHAAAVCLVAACGGSVVTIDGGAPDGSSADGGATDAGAADAARDGASCEALAMRLEPLRQAAIKCTVSGVQKPCGQFVKDLCCPLSVTDTSTPAVKAFIAAVEEYVKLCPALPCPPVACPDKPSGVCGMQLTCMQF
jgi:hypothetical protein